MNEHINLDETLYEMDVNGLKCVVTFYEKQLKAIHARITQLENYTDMDEDSRRRLRFLRNLPHRVQENIKAGFYLPDALDVTARQYDVNKATVKIYWEEYKKSKKPTDRIEKINFVLDLATLGYKNAVIGEIVGWHPNHVSRVISQERKKRLDYRRYAA